MLTSPKTDKRFVENGQVSYDLDTEEETKQDNIAAQKLNNFNNAFTALSPELISTLSSALEPYVNEKRRDRIKTVLNNRTIRSKFLFENPSNPSNVWACLRTIGSFGVQNVNVIMESQRYIGKQALVQKRGMRTAVGSAQWLSLKNHATTSEALQEIRNQGYKIYASDLNPKSKDIRDVNWDAGPVCVVMGNEESGISDEIRNAADETFNIPMVGFAESFNLSAATSITLAHMSATSRLGKGPLRAGDIGDHQINCLYVKGLLNSLPKKRLGEALLRHHNIVLPKEFDLL